MWPSNPFADSWRGSKSAESDFALAFRTAALTAKSVKDHQRECVFFKMDRIIWSTSIRVVVSIRIVSRAGLVLTVQF